MKNKELEQTFFDLTKLIILNKQFMYILFIKKNKYVTTLINTDHAAKISFLKFVDYVEFNRKEDFYLDYCYHIVKCFIIKNYKNIDIITVIKVNIKLKNIIDDLYIRKNLIKVSNRFFNLPRYIRLNLLEDVHYEWLVIKQTFLKKNEDIINLYNICTLSQIHAAILEYDSMYSKLGVSDFLLKIYKYHNHKNDEIFFKCFNSKIHNYPYLLCDDNFHFYKSMTFNLMNHTQRINYIKFLYSNNARLRLNILNEQCIGNKYKQIINGYLFNLKLKGS